MRWLAKLQKRLKQLMALFWQLASFAKHKANRNVAKVAKVSKYNATQSSKNKWTDKSNKTLISILRCWTVRLHKDSCLRPNLTGLWVQIQRASKEAGGPLQRTCAAARLLSHMQCFATSPTQRSGRQVTLLFSGAWVTSVSVHVNPSHCVPVGVWSTGGVVKRWPWHEGECLGAK